MFEKLKFVPRREKNIVGKEKNADYQHFLLIQMFSKGYFSRVVKSPDSSLCAEPHSSVGSIADLRTGRWFDSMLSQYSFQRLMIVIATGFIPLSMLSVVSTMNIWQRSQWLGKKIVYWLKELQESMDRCTGHNNITERLLKTVLNTIQSINE